MTQSTDDKDHYRHSPLEEFHCENGAKMVPFAGWIMPLSYGSERSEHLAVRSQTGLFDLSHMGGIIVSGSDAARYLNRHFVSDIEKIRLGKAKYTLCCGIGGEILEDLVVYRIDNSQYLLIVNASNTYFISQRLQETYGFSVKVDHLSGRYALIAIQGPKSVDVLQKIADQDITFLSYYSIMNTTIKGIESFIARTGYTGEDGFEILSPVEDINSVVNLLLNEGSRDGIRLCGLAARDSLRLEAGMALYGNELTPETNPFEAGLSRLVDFSKREDFIGRSALLDFKDQVPGKTLVGLEVFSKRPARHDYKLAVPVASYDPANSRSADLNTFMGRISTNEKEEECELIEVGRVTSGIVSPSLNKSIAMAYIDTGFALTGSDVYIEMRSDIYPAKVVNLPFYVRNKV